MKKLLAIAILVGLSALAVPAAAKAKPVKSKVTLDPVGIIAPDGSIEYFFGGSVSAGGLPPLSLRPRARPSAKSIRRKVGDAFKCMKHRNVRVFRDEPKGEDTLIGSDRTNVLGGYLAARVTDLDQIPGDYYASVRKKKVRTMHGRVRCAGDQSRTVTMESPDVD